VKVTALSPAHADSAADVLAEFHVGTEAAPTSALADRETARRAVDAAIGAGPGVAAFDGSSIVGYMVAPLPAVPGPTVARLGPAHHAVRPASARPAYRRMYEVLAGKLVAAGLTYHSLPVPAAVLSAVEACFELGFGVDQIRGAVPLRDLQPSAAAEAKDVRTATAGDLDGLLQLAVELTKFHARAPMFQPALLDVRQIRQDLIRAIGDDSATVLVVADEGRPVAMMSAQPDSAYAHSLVIGMNVVTESARSAGLGKAMLSKLLGWAKDRAYQYCTVGWASSNPISDAFYRSHGFTPIRYRLHRRIDPAIAWANETLDYSVFQA
jgi:GNAT superfamily N-acetyltransferase